MKKDDTSQKSAIQELKKYFPNLPNDLNIGGWLDLRGTQITSLPDNLTVGGWLYLRGTQIKLSNYWVVSKQIGSRDDISYYSIKENFVVCGCFKGSLDDFNGKKKNCITSSIKITMENPLIDTKDLRFDNNQLFVEQVNYQSKGIIKFFSWMGDISEAAYHSKYTVAVWRPIKFKPHA